MKIILAIDSSDFSKVAIKELTKMPLPNGSEVCIINVYEHPAMATPELMATAGTLDNYFHEFVANAEKSGKRIVSAAAEELKKSNSTITITTSVVSGLPKKEILEKAESFEAEDWRERFFKKPQVLIEDGKEIALVDGNPIPNGVFLEIIYPIEGGSGVDGWYGDTTYLMFKDNKLHHIEMPDGKKAYADEIETHQNSNISGNIESKNAALGGLMKGNVNSEKITIKKTANVEGVLNQKSLVIEEGAVLKIKTETHK